MKIKSSVIRAFKALYYIFRDPRLLNRVLQEPGIWERHIQMKYDLTAGLPVVDMSALFGRNFSSELDVFTFLDGGSLVTDLVLLKELAGGIPDCRYFEIGTWRGESVINVAAVAAECYTLNLSDDELRRRKVPEGVIEQQGYFSKNKDNIVHLKGDSVDFNFAGLNKKFDLIFIDGSHHYEDVKNDTEKVFMHLVHEKSIVVWHDYAENPESMRFEVFSGILDGLDPGLHSYLYHVSNTKSAIFIRGNFETRPLTMPMRPDNFFRISLNHQEMRVKLRE